MSLSNTAIPVEYMAFKNLVLDGEVPVNKWISLEMNRIDFLISSPDYYYDDKAIDGFIKFSEKEMTLTDGADLMLLPSFRMWAESLLAWFEFVEIKVYSQLEKKYVFKTVKRRLVNKQYLIVGRGAAKSLYSSLMQAYILTIDKTTTNGIVTAPTMKLSEETMAPIRTAIARSKGPLFKYLTSGSILSNSDSKVKLASTKKGIQNFSTNSIVEIRPMSVDKLQGARPKISTIDEWLSGKVKEDVVGAIEQGASKVDDYIILATSSEGTARDGVGDTIKMELNDILIGSYFQPHVSIWYYRLDTVEEVGNPDMWLKANPNIGTTVSYEAYQRDVERAEAQPSTRPDILAKRFGIPVEGYSYFFLYEQTLLHSKQSFNGMLCVMGADLSQGDDFCAFTFLFPLGGGRFGVKTRSYVSKFKVSKLPTATRNKYQEFIDEHTLVVMDTVVLDMLEVYEDLNEFIYNNEYDVIAMGYDPYNAKDFVSKWEETHGSYGLSKIRQGVKTESVPLGEIRSLAEERLLLFDEELMKFALGNSIAIEDTNGNRKLSKKRQSEKIDNVAALLDAWIVFKENQEAFV